MFLLKTITRFIGVNSQRNQYLMKRIQVDNIDQVISTLQKLFGYREFIPYSSTRDYFIRKMQKNILNQNKNKMKIIKAYSIMKKMEMIEIPFRKALGLKMCQHLNNNYDIKNQEVQQILWFIKKENPFWQVKFKEVAQQHTIKLFDMYQHMNQLQQLPTCQPYLRIVTMLKYLGHQINVRKDIFKPSQINRIHYLYLPFVADLLSKQQAQSLTKSLNLHLPFKTHLAFEFLSKQKLQYDLYLQRIQQIDNQSQAQTVDRTYDIIEWHDIINLIDLVHCSQSQEDQYPDLEYTAYQLFWRKLQTRNIDCQAIILLLQSLKKYGCYNQNNKSIVLRSLQTLLLLESQEVRFVPASGILKLIQYISELQFVKDSQKDILDKLNKEISTLIDWQQIDRVRFKQIKLSNKNV